MKIGIIGLGKVGMEYAYSLLNSRLDINEIDLIDVDEQTLYGKYLDLTNTLVSLEKNTNIKIAKYEDLKDADLVCITAGAPQGKQMKSRDEDLKKCDSIFKNIIPQIVNSKFSGIYLIASNPLDVMCYRTLQMANVPARKVIGSGTLLDTSRLRCILAKKYHKNLLNVKGLVLGEHGETSFIPWQTVNIDVLDEDKEEINKQVKKMGFEIVSRTGFTCYGVASALLKITYSIFEDRKDILPVCTYLKSYDVCISTPSRIGSIGVIENNLLRFNKPDYEEFIKSIEKIKKSINVLEK